MVLDSETYQLHPSLRKIMSGFLQSDAWEKPKVAAPVKVTQTIPYITCCRLLVYV